MKHSPQHFRRDALHLPLHGIFRLEDIVPQTLWDVTDRILLRPRPHVSQQYPMVIAIAVSGTIVSKPVRLIILVDYRSGGGPVCQVFNRDKYPRQAAMIFDETHRNDSMSWPDLRFRTPDLDNLTDAVEIASGLLGYGNFTITVSFREKMVDSLAGTVEVVSMEFDITRGSAQWQEDSD